MAQFVVRNLEEDVKARLQRRARRHGRSMEEEVRSILRNAVRDERSVQRGLGSRMASRFKDDGLDQPLPEVPGNARPAKFEP